MAEAWLPNESHAIFEMNEAAPRLHADASLSGSRPSGARSFERRPEGHPRGFVGVAGHLPVDGHHFPSLDGLGNDQPAIPEPWAQKNRTLNHDLRLNVRLGDSGGLRCHLGGHRGGIPTRARARRRGGFVLGAPGRSCDISVHHEASEPPTPLQHRTLPCVSPDEIRRHLKLPSAIPVDLDVRRALRHHGIARTNPSSPPAPATSVGPGWSWRSHARRPARHLPIGRTRT
jgi:hypothetical protein